MDSKYYDVILTLLEIVKEQRGNISYKDYIISDQNKEITELKLQLEGVKTDE